MTQALLNDLLAAFDALPKLRPLKLSTGPVRRVLARLGNPQNDLPPVIHVAGTNGKGSTTAFMRALAEAHGLQVHVDTSPHLIRVNERIRVAGKLIPDDDLARHTERVLDANAGEPLSFFEGMTIASFLAFRETHADMTLIEVGLGGRFDSTNVIEQPRVSVITPIDYDHRDFLGHHLAQIAWEKAGIIKPGCPVVSAAQAPDVDRTLRAEAFYRKAPFASLPEQVSIEPGPDEQVAFRIGDFETGCATLGLTGAHQHQNAALALLAFQTSGLTELKRENVETGLASVEWPARLQALDKGPLTDRLGGRTILLDGGHNPHAARAVAKALAGKAPVPVIMAILATKDARPFVEAICGIAERIIAIPLPGPHRAHDPAYLASLAQQYGVPSATASDLDAALAMISGSDRETALIAGSLYLAGHVLKSNEQTIE